MSYSSIHGHRPNEYASKSSHSNIIQDPKVVEFLGKCNLPKSSEGIDIPSGLFLDLPEMATNPIKHIVAVDGGYTEVAIKKDFPSSTLTFFQFGALVFSISDLGEIAELHFIDPEDIAKLNNIQRIKFVLPTKNIRFKDQESFTSSFRKSLFEFFGKSNAKNLGETLKWFLFKEYLTTPEPSYILASCPSCKVPKVILKRVDITKDFLFPCPSCNGEIFLTDAFRLHEAIDDELGAAEVCGYLATVIEQMIIVDLIRAILDTKPSLLSEILIIKDGPLGFFGPTANMHKLMRDFVNFLFDNHNLFLVGLEKSGIFVEHAATIGKKLKPGSVLLLSNEYIYQYILPGKAEPSKPYAGSSYYGSKIIFKSRDEKIYVATLPTRSADVIINPKKEDFQNIDVILNNVEKLKCDMYDNALFPIALVNKLVSLADHPSSNILEKFAKANISK